jgi:hypothetical protein
LIGSVTNAQSFLATSTPWIVQAMEAVQSPPRQEHEPAGAHARPPHRDMQDQIHAEHHPGHRLPVDLHFD